METHRDSLIEEALRRHDQHDGFEAFLAEHPEIASDVQDSIRIQRVLSAAASTIEAPRDSFARVLKGLDAKPATSLKELPSVSPYFSMPLFRIGVPALLILIIVLGVSGTGPGSDVATQESDSAAMDTMNMKAMPAGNGAPEAVMMSMTATVEEPQPVPPTGSVDDLVRALEEDAKAEIAAATLGEENFAAAVDDSAVLQEFIHAYDENQF